MYGSYVACVVSNDQGHTTHESTRDVSLADELRRKCNEFCNSKGKR